MGRSHKKECRSRSKSKGRARTGGGKRHRGGEEGLRTGWRQQDYQRAAGAAAVEAAAEEDEEEEQAVPAPAPRSSSRKKRQATPAWMLEPGDVPPSAAAAGSSAAASSSAAAATPSSTPPLSDCWSRLPRDTLLVVFSFFDLHALARLTCSSHYWYACLRRSVMARVLEQSWRILRQRKQQQLAAEVASEVVGGGSIPRMHRLSDIIAPTHTDGGAFTLDDDVSIALALPPASPALSAVPPPAALKTVLALPAAAGPSSLSVCVPGAPFSSSATLFKASMLHLRSLYHGQKQLQYALLSNPLFQNLSVLYFLSACHERVLGELRGMHVVLYRSKHRGKWPRSTKAEEGSAREAATIGGTAPDATAVGGSTTVTAPPTSTAATFDLMPLHFNLDAAVHHRTAFLAELQRSQKHVWELLHDSPVQECFGFDGSSLPSVQLGHLRRRMEERLQEQLRGGKGAPDCSKRRAGAHQSAAAAAAAAAAREASRVSDPVSDEVILHAAEDLPAQFVPASSSSSIPLLTAADAAQVDGALRRMGAFSHIWARYLHSSGAQHLQAEEAAARAAAHARAHGMEESDEATPMKPVGVSALEREWDACALLWRSQHTRLRRLHLFWSTLAHLLQERERETVLADLVASRHRTAQQAQVPSEEQEGDAAGQIVDAATRAEAACTTTSASASTRDELASR